MSNKSRADLNVTLTEALVTGGRRTTAAGVRGALTDILDSMAVYGDMHVVSGATAQELADAYEALIFTGGVVGQSLGMTLTAASGEITPAVAGTYCVSVRLRCVGEAGVTYSIRLTVNGTPAAYLLDEATPVGTEEFLLLLTGHVQTSAVTQDIVLEAMSSESGGADLTIVQGSFSLQRVQ